MGTSGKKNQNAKDGALKASTKVTSARHSPPDKQKKKPAIKRGGLDEIESLFASKKKQKQEQQQQQQLKEKHKKSSRENKRKIPPAASKSKEDWVDDGLGGIYNSEGYTGRVEDGMKIFKTHLLQSSKSGTTPDCPFDCDCCFI